MKFILCLLLTAPFIGKAQHLSVSPIDTAISVAGASKVDLYKRAKVAIVNSFKEPDKVIVLDDPETGKIMLKGSSRETSSDGMLDGYFQYSIQLDFKDGRFRYQVYNISHSKWGSLERPLKLLTDKPEFRDLFPDAMAAIGVVTSSLIGPIVKNDKSQW